MDKPLTINDLLALLRKEQRSGRGHQTVFIHRTGDKFCMPATDLKSYHGEASGHVVIHSSVTPESLEA